MTTGRVERLDHAERWLRDGLRVVGPPGALLAVEVDMSEATALRQSMKESGTPVTYTHLLVEAVARALTAHPELHRLVAGNRKLHPDSIDICLSVAGEGVVTPVLIVRDAGQKSLAEIAGHIRDRAPEARRRDEELNRILRRWGWILPFAFLRRSLLRSLLSRLWYRRRASGTFQVSVISSVDLFVPFLFNTAAALGAGRVSERVVAVEGRSEIRPVLTLACCIDHTVWNGMDAAQFLNSVKDHLERPVA